MLVLENKVALITGSTSGIGEAIAVQLWSLGASVIITGYENYGHIETVVNRLRNNQPPMPTSKQTDGLLSTTTTTTKQKVIGIRADILDDRELDSLVDRVRSEFDSRLDILVNNAGIALLASFTDTDCLGFLDEELKFLRAIQRLTRQLIPLLMMASGGGGGGGSIVNVSSYEKPYYKALPTLLSKSSLDMFSKCLAHELAPNGIRVNSVGPGVIETPAVINHPMLKHLVFLPQYLQTIPLGRMGTAVDVANTVVYLIVQSTAGTGSSSGGNDTNNNKTNNYEKNNNSFITGMKINITGGQ
ncbi:uncharacterized oxidoreductase MexAM1_META1p0182-like [Oppia nitens]|uniref:uncharacterized oxidoreductase MexAM1_META1p0182-like n=1 Tax=Oppia nitens TaxID=1686743 RepID=UPI0023DCBC69|nr:uncharacterized oxidoreductase MexAM1_META1p0182-like [Oppia nitens]